VRLAADRLRRRILAYSFCSALSALRLNSAAEVLPGTCAAESRGASTSGPAVASSTSPVPIE